VTTEIRKQELSEQEILDQAKKMADVWIQNLNLTGKPNKEKILEVLSARTYKGKPVKAVVVESPKEAVECLKKFYEEEVPEEHKKEARKVLSNAYNCIWDYYLMAFYETFFHFLPNKDFPEAEFIRQSLFPAFKEGLGFVILLGQLNVGVTLPEAHLDDERRLHSPIGPALRYNDAELNEYWWHGVQVPMEWIENKDEIDYTQAINHPNIEQRRALCEIVGWDKIIDSLNPAILDVDQDPQIGTLLEVDLPDHGKQKFLRVVEAQTGRQFALMAPDDVETALDAQAEINQIPKELFRTDYVRT
jgi:hypothetical protein